MARQKIAAQNFSSAVKSSYSISCETNGRPCALSATLPNVYEVTAGQRVTLRLKSKYTFAENQAAGRHWLIPQTAIASWSPSESAAAAPSSPKTDGATISFYLMRVGGVNVGYMDKNAFLASLQLSAVGPQITFIPGETDGHVQVLDDRNGDMWLYTLADTPWQYRQVASTLHQEGDSDSEMDFVAMGSRAGRDKIPCVDGRSWVDAAIGSTYPRAKPFTPLAGPAKRAVYISIQGYLNGNLDQFDEHGDFMHGRFAWIQTLKNFEYKRTPGPGGPPGPGAMDRSLPGESMLDGHLPYSWCQDNVSDVPAMQMPRPNYSQISKNFIATMYLMWRPLPQGGHDSTIWIPVGNVLWLYHSLMFWVGPGPRVVSGWATGSTFLDPLATAQAYPTWSKCKLCTEPLELF